MPRSITMGIAVIVFDFDFFFFPANLNNMYEMMRILNLLLYSNQNICAFV